MGTSGTIILSSEMAHQEAIGRLFLMDDPDGGLDERGNLNGSGDFTQTVVMGVKINAMWQNSTWLSDVNFIPFYILNGNLENVYLIRFGWVQFASNVLMTVPFGLGVNFVARFRRKDFLWLPFAVGFGIELSQFFINWILGYPYRVVDVTDALLNAAGFLIGYGIFRLFSRVYIAASSGIHKEPRGLFATIHEVASRE